MRAVLGERGDHRREHAPERPGGVGGHGENLPSGSGPGPARTPTPRTGARTTRPTSPRPGVRSDPLPAPTRASGAQVSPWTSRSTSVTTSRSACGRKAAYTAPPPITQNAPCSSSTCLHRRRGPRAARGRPVRVRRQDDVGPAGQRTEALGQRLPGAPAHDDGASPMVSRRNSAGPPAGARAAPPSAPMTPSRACAQMSAMPAPPGPARRSHRHGCPDRRVVAVVANA